MADEDKTLVKSPFLSREVAFRHIAYVLEQGFMFHANLWSDDPKVRKANEDYMKKHPREYRAREKSFAMFLNHYGPNLRQEPTKQEKPPIDIETLEEMNLSDEKLEELAGIKKNKG